MNAEYGDRIDEVSDAEEENMKIVLNPHEIVDVEFEGTDGCVRIRYDDSGLSVSVDGRCVWGDAFATSKWLRVGEEVRSADGRRRIGRYCRASHDAICHFVSEVMDGDNGMFIAGIHGDPVRIESIPKDTTGDPCVYCGRAR